MTRYTTSQTVTAPSAGTYDIGVWGGGGGGGNSLSGGGGGGGAFSYASVAVANGDQLVLTIPAAAGAGSNGGTVTVVRSAVTLCSANGGSAGGTTAAGAGGTTGGTGSTKFAGGTGGSGDIYTDPEPPNTVSRARGGGGGAAGRGGVGGTGGSGTADFGDVIEGTGGSGNTSYAGTEFDGSSGGGGGSAGGVTGGGGGGGNSGGKGAVELIFTASDVTPPTINTNAAQNNVEGSVLAVSLTANETITNWAIRTSAQNGASVDYTHFEISGTTLRWASNGVKDFESPNDTGTNNTYVVVIRATDTAALTTDKTITVTVTDKADETAPTITHSANHNVQENSLLAISLTANESVTWSLAGGSDQADFEISGSTLRWAGNVARDYDLPVDSDVNNVYNVTVRATDTSSNQSTLAMTVTVTQDPGEAADTGYVYPTGTPTQDASGGNAWASLANLVSDNASYASVTSMSATETSHIVTMSGFDLSALPDDATVDGIELQAEIGGDTGTGTVTSVTNFQIKGTGSVKSTPAGAVGRDQDPSPAVFTLGGAADVWGLSGGNLTGSGLKSSFDVRMDTDASATGSGNGTIRVDYVRVKIFYTEASPRLGTLDAELGILTSTGSTSALLNSGLGGGTLEELISGFDSTIFIKGAAGVSFGALTTTSAAVLPVVGVSAKTLGALTSVAEGSLGVVTLGTVAKTLAGVSTTSASALIVKGVSARTLAALTTTSAAALIVKASSARTLAALTSVVTGGAPPLGGVLAKTFNPLTSVSAATLKTFGLSAPSLAALTSASAAALKTFGASARTLAALTSASGAKIFIAGAGGSGTLGVLTLVSSGFQMVYVPEKPPFNSLIGEYILSNPGTAIYRGEYISTIPP